MQINIEVSASLVVLPTVFMKPDRRGFAYRWRGWNWYADWLWLRRVLSFKRS